MHHLANGQQAAFKLRMKADVQPMAKFSFVIGKKPCILTLSSLIKRLAVEPPRR
jgi:hypothetical protein